ncbi:LADA_0F03180g1_1 [Lachancea dasiensis]|uniref:Anaphase-promoting complex subunit 4 n=1 Tax=Lachancea dasiensis TaxID=1072105 RepID=A0A1G4JIM5_9SACH|nr:LADA_0F03180g1_1 [Lachancea dasiensis]
MVKWHLKGITKLGQHEDVIWNPKLALYLVVRGKTVAIHRATDDQLIGTVQLKDHEQVIGFQWDQTEGKQFATFYSNGTVKIYDCATSGNLRQVINVLAWQNEENVALDFAVWSRSAWDQFPVTYAALETDLPALMPGMVRIVRDSKQVSMAPLESWDMGQHTKPDTAILLAHYKGSNTGTIKPGYVLNIGNQITVRFESGITDMFKILPPKNKHGPFVGVGSNGAIEYIRLPLLESPLMGELVKCSGQVRSLCSYLIENIAVCKTDVIEPYAVFLTRITDAFDADLYTQLCEVLLTGYVTLELEDWLCSSIGDKNYKRWKQLSSRMYRDLSNILAVAIIPACERLLLMCEKLQGVHKSVRLQKMTELHEFDEQKWASPQVDELKTAVEDVLKDVLQWAVALNRESAIHGSFADWFFDVVMECVDEDYKKPIGRQGAALQIREYLEKTWRVADAPVASSQIQSLHSRVQDTVVTCSHRIDQVYTKPWVLELIDVSSTEGGSISHPKPISLMLDATCDESGSLFVAFTASPGTSNLQVSVLPLQSVAATTTSPVSTFGSSISSAIVDATFLQCNDFSLKLVVLHETESGTANVHSLVSTLEVIPSNLIASKLTLVASKSQILMQTEAAAKLVRVFPSGPILSVHYGDCMAIHEMSCENDDSDVDVVLTHQN